MMGGSDDYDNLTIIHPWIHILIHETKFETIGVYKVALHLTSTQIDKINQFCYFCKLPNL